jgi:hypothetical protein
MAADELKASKEMLEVQKLEIEIQKLRRPWWSEPSYISAFLPTMIALTSLLIVWRTGFLDVKSINLDTKKTKLETDVRDFELRRDALGQTNARLSRETDSLRAAKTNLDGQLRSLESNLATIVEQRDEATSDRDALRTQKVILEGQREKLAAAVQSERQAARLAPVREMVRDLSRSAPSHRLPVGGMNVIRHLRSDPSLRTLYSAEMASFLETAEPVNRAFALQAEALGTGDVAVTNRLLAEVDNWIASHKDSAEYPTIIWTLNDSEVEGATSAKWSPAEREQVLLLAAKTLDDEKVSPRIREACLTLVYSNLINSRYVLHSTNPALAIRLVRAGRTTALDRQADTYAREAGFSVLRTIAPPAFIVVVSQVFTDSTEENKLLIELERTVPWLESSESAKKLSPPSRRDPALWASWRSANPSIVTLWSGSLDGLERDPGLARHAIEGHAQTTVGH